MQNKDIVRQAALKIILIAGLCAGLLDGASAVIILAKMNLERVFRYVASAVFDKAAFTGGKEMMVYGILFHFAIALCWAAVYYFFYQKVPLVRRNFIISGILYGVVVWIAMNLLLVPLTHVKQAPFTFEGIAKNMVILMYAIGLTIAFITHRFCAAAGKKDPVNP
jgi:uncharacterized membrane protein YagU involved in acid resistance